MSTNAESTLNSELPVVDKDEFNTKLQNYYKAHSANSKKLGWTRARIENVIKLLEEYDKAKFRGIRATNKQYHHAHKYDVVKVGNRKVLFLKRKDNSHPLLEMIPTEDYYQKILDAHLATGHGRRDKIVHTLRNKYMIPIFAIKIFLELCRVCIVNKSNYRYNAITGPTQKPMHSNDFNQKGQINLIDFQTSPDNEYKWLMQYQDQKTKFSFLQPLKSREGKEVALEILKIFLQIGCPHVLQSCSGIEFTKTVLSEITTLWPACEVIKAKSINSQHKESLETSKQDIKNMIQAWMVDNNSSNWSFGCYFVQFQMNSSYHLSTSNTPYKAVFGTEPRLGVSNSSDNIESHLQVEVKVEEVSEQSDDDEDITLDQIMKDSSSEE